MPRLKRNTMNKVLETAEQEMGEDTPRILRSTGPARKALDAPTVEVVDKPVDKEWAEMMLFSKMPVTIVINESTDKNAEDPIFFANNGDPKWLYRGKEHTMERRFVESLARAKVTTYSQRKEVDPNGIPHIVNVPHTACRYPFRVINDPHPRGADWLKHILLER